MVNEKVAIIDLGTNTFHLLVAEFITDGFNVLLKEKTMVKIGQGGISEGIIAADAYERAISAIDNFKLIITKYKVKKVYATATSAIRNASNGISLVDEIKKRTDIDVKIISGTEEADLIYYGVKSALKIKDTSVIVDIGGGSVEFIICNELEILWKGSFEIGAQRLLDKFHEEDPLTSTSRKKLYEYLEKNLKSLTHAIKQYQPKVLIGCSGTFDTLAEIYHQENEIYMSDKSTEFILPIEDYIRIHEEIITKNREERLLIPGMVEMRVDMIVVASCLIKFLVQNYPINKIRVSTYALKEGLLDTIIKNEQLI